MSYIEKEKLIKADIASIENRVRHAFNQGYDLGFKDGKEKAKPQEQESTTNNDLAVDCIDRNSIKYYPGTGGYMYASKGEIDKLPSITPIRPKGHWKIVPYEQTYYCSECNCRLCDEQTYIPLNYCPNCGAKMESEDK